MDLPLGEVFSPQDAAALVVRRFLKTKMDLRSTVVPEHGRGHEEAPLSDVVVCRNPVDRRRGVPSRDPVVRTSTTHDDDATVALHVLALDSLKRAWRSTIMS